MRRLRSLIFLLAMALALTATAASADDGSGCRTDQPYVEQIYGDTAR